MRSPFLPLALIALCNGCGGGVPAEAEVEAEGFGPRAEPTTVAPKQLYEYPPGPYGTTEGARVPNIVWAGYRDGKRWDDRIELREYYDPHGELGIKAIHLVLGATWCGVVNSVAARLQTTYPPVRDRGLRLVFALIEDASRQPATRDTLDTWRAKYSIAYELVMDRLPSFGASTGTIGLPYTVLVDPRTMKIEKIIPGDGPSVDSTIEKLIARNGQ